MTPQLSFHCFFIPTACAILTALGSPETGRAASPRPEPLWPKGAPGAKGKEDADVPTVTVYLPPARKATGSAVVICPGGGYGFLASDYEGHDVARWLSGIGVAGIVLKYRIAPRYRHPAPLLDAQRAIRYTRAHAKTWRVNPHLVGILGFSAGGHLASTVGTHFDHGKKGAPDPIDRETCRPDFLILVYPVISFTAPYAHLGSRDNLLGKNAPPELVKNLSNETQVTDQTPPAFLVHTSEDTGVPPENSIAFYLALRKAKVPAEIHIFEKGPHGLGLGKNDPAFAKWPGLCARWLKLREKQKGK
jgi:acetyl esterase/lipase